jgi:putative flippase GtrA
MIMNFTVQLLSRLRARRFHLRASRYGGQVGAAGAIFTSNDPRRNRQPRTWGRLYGYGGRLLAAHEPVSTRPAHSTAMGVTGVRWVRFNLVGIMGFVLQTTMLFALVRWPGLGAASAVTIAVLAAVSHNFVWHEYFTWPDRPRESRFRRWLSFHLSTGILSVVSNVVVTLMVARATNLPLVACNAIAAAIVATANFFVCDRLVFNAQCSMPNGTEPRSTHLGH